jgi:hypothetical protein
VVALAACAAAPLHHTDVDKKLPDKVAPIAVGQTDRPQVRTMLGEPQIASNYWRFDLFRASGTNAALGLLYIVPFTMTQDVDALAFVTYDPNGTVVALDKGVNNAIPAWGGHDPPLVLNAGDAIVVHEVGRSTSLYVSPGQRDAYLNDMRPRDQCTVVLGCDVEHHCPTRLSVDGKVEPLPATAPALARSYAESSYADRHRPPPYPVRSWLTPLTLAPGDHRIETNEGQKVASAMKIQCSAGDLLYALIDSPIQVSGEMPAVFGKLPMLVYRDGWFVPQEPARE